MIEDQLGQPWIIAIMLAVFGVVLYAVDRRFAQDRHLEDVTLARGWWLGVAQALALQPGVSRSGVTITAGRLMRFDRETAARFSFLLALPIIAGAGVFKGIDLAKNGMPAGFGAEFIAGMLAAAISGYLVIAFLLTYLRRHDFAIFMWYRLAVAALVLGLIVAILSTPYLLVHHLRGGDGGHFKLLAHRLRHAGRALLDLLPHRIVAGAQK